LTKEETQGPYWFDVDTIRSDIREDRPGTTLRLAVRVQDLSRCSAGKSAAPVANSVVEIWHCDAGGVYSGFESSSTAGGNPPAGGPPAGGPPAGGPPQGGAPGGPDPGAGETSNGSYSVGDTEAATGDDGTYLRGAQVADSTGIVRFTTIYPGWYRGRTMHIHAKVHVAKKTILTTQFFVDDALTDRVYAAAPYDAHTGRDTTNADDTIFDDTGLLTVQRLDDGYLGVINLGIDV
jgi:protocatechuate 3,4-dioxygenase beta subunit